MRFIAAQFGRTSSRDCKVISSLAWNLTMPAKIVSSPPCVPICDMLYNWLLFCPSYAFTASVSIRIVNKVVLLAEPYGTTLRNSSFWPVSSRVVYIGVACSVAPSILTTWFGSFSYVMKTMSPFLQDRMPILDVVWPCTGELRSMQCPVIF